MVGPALFLASHASDYVNGAEITVDGGGTVLPMLAAQDPEVRLGTWGQSQVDAGACACICPPLSGCEPFPPPSRRRTKPAM